MTEDSKVVPIVEGVNFDLSLLDINGNELEEMFFEDESEERGAFLEQKAGLVGRMNEAEAEELISLRQKRPVKLGDQCVKILTAPLKDDKNDGVQNLRKFQLAQKIVGKGDEDEPWGVLKLSNKEKKRLLESAKAMNGEGRISITVYARVHEAIEGTFDDEEDE